LRTKWTDGENGGREDSWFIQEQREMENAERARLQTNLKPFGGAGGKNC